MEFELVTGLIFFLLLVLIIGGMILVYPISRKLDQLVELYIQEKRSRSILDSEGIGNLAEKVSALEEQVRLVGEHQRFADGLLANRQSRAELGPADR